ncbi:hypothetical protein OE749_09145 [Aestuariibacter sp. AA17]|uniref:Uncharacterized protein n=1 Tax=Fluctibacter corallii TaxID=2984329 RepID=A0ABT3A849_9ALTE|nr:hypothetical protein [Aestuariibacter sp. AA17]MCV2884860.1 hypothetical protein [Aestuariibacter sp. AA17]
MDETSAKHTFTHIRSRHVAAIVMTLLTATIMIPGMTTYLPFAIADKIGVPIFLFPFIWVGLFLYCYMAKKSAHAWIMLWGLALVHGLLSFWALK